MRLHRICCVAITILVSMASGGSRLSAQQEPGADTLLKNHGLKRIGGTYVLTSEAEFQKKISEARLLSRKLAFAVKEQQAFEHGIEGGKAIGQELLQQRMALNQQISEINRQIDSLGGANPIERNELVSQHNQIVSSLNIVTDRLNLLNSQKADSKWKQELDAEVSRRREAYIQAVLGLRELSDQIVDRYAELAKLDEVKETLKALSTPKITLKLGPSKEFLTNVKLLEKAEKSVLTEEVALRRKGGVYEVDVTFNDKITLPMIFDTGASLTTISAELAARIGLKPELSDDVITLSVADGSEFKAKRMFIRSLRVGKFTATNVECAVIPSEKRDAPLLLGQTFHRHFTYKFTGGSGRLIVSKVETGEPASAKPARKSRK